MIARLLFCDDRKTERAAFRKQVTSRLDGVESVELASLAALEALPDQPRFDVIVSDLDFSAGGGGPRDGLRILERCRARWPTASLVLFTARAESLLPRQVLELAALGLEREQLLSKLADDPAEAWARLRERVAALLPSQGAGGEPLAAAIACYAGRPLAEGVLAEDRAADPRLIARAAASRAIARRVEQAAPTPATVLITGETGVGKERVAQALHGLSGREGFVAINCATLTEELLASELFGHVAGAFTGAVTDKPGLIEQTGDGTLLLDEIGEISLPNQAKLLRLLQQGEYRPVGSSRPRRSQARILAATHRDLRADVAAGRFRADLLDRLDVYRIDIPPLRERREDVPPLAFHLLSSLEPELRERLTTIEADALAALADADWPDNLRGLAAALLRAAIDLPPGRDRLRAEDISLDGCFPASAAPGPADAEALWAGIQAGAEPATLSELSRAHGEPAVLELVRRVMRHCRGLPKDDQTRAWFGMSYRAWQHWAHYHGLTWDKVKHEQG